MGGGGKAGSGGSRTGAGLGKIAKQINEEKTDG